MDRTFCVTYSPQLVRSATGHFWRRRGGARDLLIGSVLTATFVTYAIITGDRSTSTVILTALFGINTVIPVLRYHVYLSGATEKLRKMGSPEAYVQIIDDYIAVRAASGAAELPWTSIEHVWSFPDVWLIFIGRDNYFTLPAAPMDEEAKAFIRQMVTDHGGKFR
ncbi:MAG TPA: YcxB family protein [Armatimonadota bacterium]|jgi:hypothetical protein